MRKTDKKSASTDTRTQKQTFSKFTRIFMASSTLFTKAEKGHLETIQAKFGGRWNEIRSENVEQFLAEVGLNYILRKMVQYVKPEVEIIVEDGDIKILVKLPFKTETSILRLNKEMEVENSQGKFLATAKFDNGKLLVSAKPADGNSAKPVETTREINAEGEMVTTFKIQNTDVVSTRTFAKVE